MQSCTRWDEKLENREFDERFHIGKADPSRYFPIRSPVHIQISASETPIGQAETSLFLRAVDRIAG